MTDKYFPLLIEWQPLRPSGKQIIWMNPYVHCTYWGEYQIGITFRKKMSVETPFVTKMLFSINFFKGLEKYLYFFLCGSETFQNENMLHKKITCICCFCFLWVLHSIIVCPVGVILLDFIGFVGGYSWVELDNRITWLADILKRGEYFSDLVFCPLIFPFKTENMFQLFFTIFITG